MVIISTSATEVSIQAVSPPRRRAVRQNGGNRGTAAYLSVSGTAATAAAQAGVAGGAGLAAGAAAGAAGRRQGASVAAGAFCA